MRLVKRKVILNLKNDRSFRGILWERRFGVLVLRQAELLKPGGQAVKMDGELVVFKSDVDFIQVVN